jgi:hypothetical protein
LAHDVSISLANAVAARRGIYLDGGHALAAMVRLDVYNADPTEPLPSKHAAARLADDLPAVYCSDDAANLHGTLASADTA